MFMPLTKKLEPCEEALLIQTLAEVTQPFLHHLLKPP